MMSTSTFPSLLLLTDTLLNQHNDRRDDRPRLRELATAGAVEALHKR